MTTRERNYLVLAALLTAAGLVIDSAAPLGVAAGLPYLIVVSVCLLSRSRRLLLAFGLVGIGLTLAGVFFSPPGQIHWMAATNRGLTLLALALLTGLGYRLLSHQRALEEELRTLAETDVLTGLASRRRLFEELNQRVAEAARYASELSLLLFDLDEFKEINDRWGHLLGDEVLRQVVKESASVLRGTDLLGRYGGDEFVVICPSTGPRGARRLAERVRASVEGLDLSSIGIDRGITVSVGVASWDEEIESATALLSYADKALYQAKESGRNRVSSASFRRAKAV